jgi:D-alanine--poly(phosphoribitol) ligase subunit 2
MAILETVTGESEVRTNRELDLYEHQLLDSLRTLQLLAALTEQFATNIALTEVERGLWATPNRVIAFMERRVGV